MNTKIDKTNTVRYVIKHPKYGYITDYFLDGSCENLRGLYYSKNKKIHDAYMFPSYELKDFVKVAKKRKYNLLSNLTIMKIRYKRTTIEDIKVLSDNEGTVFDRLAPELFE